MTVKTEMSNRQLEIMEAAGHIMTIEGLSGLTTKNLAKEMKFSESALYRHFNSKEEIVISLLNFLANEMQERLQDVIVKETDGKSQFEAIFNSQFEFFRANPHFLVAVFSDGLLDESKHINEKVLAIMNLKISLVKPVISQCQYEGIFRNDISSQELAFMVLGTFRLLMFRWRASKFEFDLTNEGNRMIQSLLALISN